VYYEKHIVVDNKGDIYVGMYVTALDSLPLPLSKLCNIALSGLLACLLIGLGRATIRLFLEIDGLPVID
jgi:hypothetical protein